MTRLLKLLLLALSTSVSASQMLGAGGATVGGGVIGGTDGSVLFVNPAGVLAQDNANFYYDASNARLGIGTATPSYKLDVVGVNGARVANNFPYYPLIIQSAGSLGLGATPQVAFEASRGTIASPTQITSAAKYLGLLTFRGLDELGTFNTQASIDFKTTEAATSTAYGSSMSIKTVPTGSTSIASVIDIDGSQNVGIGGLSSPSAKLDVNGSARVRGLTTAGPVITDASGNLSSEAQLAITRGGTGQATANAALNALLPSQATNSGKVLTTDGSNTSWVSALTATLTSAHIYVGNGSNVATDVAMSGDVFISNTGATTIQAGAVNLATDTTGTLAVGSGGTGITSGVSGGIPYYSSNSTIASSLALDANRIVLGGGAGNTPGTMAAGTTTTVLHGNAGGAPTFGSVVNADVDAAAAIAYSKLATMSTGQILLGNAGVPTATTMSGAITIGATGTTVIGTAQVTNAMLAGSIDLTTKVTGTLPVGNGGLGIATGTSGGVPYFSGSTSIASSAALAANQLVLGGGAGVAPNTLGSLGTTSTVLHGNAAGAPTFGAVALATDVSGTLAAAQFPALTGDVTTSAGSLATTLAATTNGTLASLTKSTGVKIHGTNTNDNATAGDVGEYMEGTQTTATDFAATTQYKDVSSVALTAGDWLVCVQAQVNLNGAVGFTTWDLGIGTATGNNGAGLTAGTTDLVYQPATSTSASSGHLCTRKSLSGSATIYGKIGGTYTSGGPPQFRGVIYATRPR